jgi:hypothetical protein
MPVDEWVMNQSGLFTPSDLYAAPQHVDPRPPWWILSQAIHAALRGESMQDGESELRRTPQSGSWGTAPRGTITPLIDHEEEAKDRGFLEEASTRPAG